MKASVKFRDDQKPLFKAKIPLNILGFPFQSGVFAGESKELTLNLATFFQSGPSIRIAYRPNDSYNPFSLVVKTGSGPFGSPISSSMVMSVDCNLIGRQNPSFMLHFKPNFGDFSIKKSHQSSMLDKFPFKSHNNSFVSRGDEDDASIELVEAPDFMGKKITILPSKNSIAGLFSGLEVEARTAVPVRGRAVVNFRWGVRVPSEAEALSGTAANSTSGIGFRKIPFLLMNKIGIEHVDDVVSKAVAKPKPDESSGSSLAFPENSQVAEVYSIMKRQFEVLRAENGMMRKAVDDLRQEFTGSPRSRSDLPAGNFDSAKFSEYERIKNRSVGGKNDWQRNDNKKLSSDISCYGGKPMEGNASEDLKKALKGTGGP